MCTVCGCSPWAAEELGMQDDRTMDDGGADEHAHAHHHFHGGPTLHSHAHRHRHEHESGHGREHEHGHLYPRRRLITVEQDILAENDRWAARNRAWFRARKICTVNLMSAPGSGKTTLLTRTIADQWERTPIAVIEGDQETSFDADRIRATGAAAMQINTGKGCHLDARMVDRALTQLAPAPGSLVFIENVGNLVCPAAFDLGEDARAVLLSVTEGDDKPLKYANMFAAAQAMVITKVDLLPFVAFDLDRCRAYAHRVNPEVAVICVSTVSGAGLDDWYAWLEDRQMAQARPRVAEAGVG